MVSIIKKWFDGVVKSYDAKPEKKSAVIRIGDLQYKTKKEFETLGRKIGIEVDRRLTKAKIIKQIKKHK